MFSLLVFLKFLSYILSMAMKILKFGGSSIATPDRIRNVMDIIERASGRNRGRIAVVFSAFGGVTDQLLGMSELAAGHREQYRDSFTELKKRHTDAVKRLIGRKRRKTALAAVLEMIEELRDTVHGVYLVKECSLKTRDFILGFGERLSSTIIAEAMKERGMIAEYCDSRPLVKTDSQFGSARVDIDATYRNIRARFANRKPQAARKRTVLPKPGAPKVPRQQVEGPLQVITGFIGSTPDDETTTLGRGGSDYTASLFGAALGVEEIEIWTDVDGVMTADPRKV
jgi:aspartokinase/homoserine dehydrogenase 1